MMMSWIRDSLKSGPVRNLTASYFCFASTAAYGFASLPVAVHFLDKEQIGLWNVISQAVTYLLFLELGVGTAVGRMLAEPLALNRQDAIDRTWSTILVILAAQSVIILCCGWLFSPHLGEYFKLSPELAEDACFLWLGMVVLHASAFVSRAFIGVLLCQERYHWTLIISGFTPWIQLAAFAVLLSYGAGLRSYVYATLLVNLCQFFWLRHLIRTGPHHLHFRLSDASWQHARTIIGYGFSMMLWTIAPAVLAGIPAMVIGRSLGLEQVSIYVVTSRVPMMVSMLAMRGFHAFFPKLQNLYVHQDRERFLCFYRLATSLSLLMTGLGLILAMLMNRYVVTFLAREDFYAGPVVTWWFAMGFIIMAVSEHLGCLFIIAGKGKLVSVALALEMVMTVVAASLLSSRYGLAGVAAVLALAPMIIRIPYYLAFGPKTCAFSASALYQHAAIAVTSALLMVAAVYLLQLPSQVSFVTISGVLVALCAAVLAMISVRHLLRDVREIRAVPH
jgi:O-antigen/teichoic acid export membrane protein